MNKNKQYIDKEFDEMYNRLSKNFGETNYDKIFEAILIIKKGQIA